MIHSRARVTIIALLLVHLLFAAAPASSQPAPPPPQCPEGQVLNMSGTRCINPGDPQQGGAIEDPPADDPAPPVDPGYIDTLSLMQWVCTADLDPMAVQDANGGPANACRMTNPPPISLTITAGTTFTHTATLQAPSGDAATLQLPAIDGDPVPAGSLTFTIAPVEGYALGLVFCEGPNIRSIEPPISGGTTATIQTTAGMVLRCSVYVVSTVPEDKPYRVDLGGGSITIGLLSVYCPADISADDDLDRICSDGASNVPFLVQSEAQDLAANVTDRNGTLFFEDVKEGNLAIIETIPSGYGQPVVRCTWYSTLFGTTQIEPDILYGNGFMIGLAPNDEIQCTFFNMPAAGPDNGPIIQIQLSSCVPNSGVANATTYDEAISNPNCGDFGFSRFSVSTGGQVVDARDSTNQGQVLFNKLPVVGNSGTYTISKDSSNGSTMQNAFCDLGPVDGPYEVIPIEVTSKREFTATIAVDQVMRCTVFIDQLSPTPDAPAEDAGGNDQLVGDGNNVGGANPDDPGNTIDPNQQPANSGAGQVKLAGPSLNGDEEGDTAANDSPTTVTIQFWTCPDGMDQAAQQEDLLFTCTADASSRDVSVAYDGATNSESIPGYGSWQLSGSDFSLAIPPQTSRAWCSSSGAGGSQFPEEVDVSDGTLSLALPQPVTTYCDWFTAPNE